MKVRHGCMVMLREFLFAGTRGSIPHYCIAFSQVSSAIPSNQLKPTLKLGWWKLWMLIWFHLLLGNKFKQLFILLQSFGPGIQFRWNLVLLFSFYFLSVVKGLLLFSFLQIKTIRKFGKTIYFLLNFDGI